MMMMNEKLLRQNMCKFEEKKYTCLHALCVRNKYPADDSTILYNCDLNALGGFNFYTEGGPRGHLSPGYPHTGSLMQSLQSLGSFP